MSQNDPSDALIIFRPVSWGNFPPKIFGLGRFATQLQVSWLSQNMPSVMGAPFAPPPHPPPSQWLCWSSAEAFVLSPHLPGMTFTGQGTHPT